MCLSENMLSTKKSLQNHFWYLLIRKLTGHGTWCDPRTNRERRPLQVGKIDEHDFRVEVSALQLPCKVNLLIDTCQHENLCESRADGKSIHFHN